VPSRAEHLEKERGAAAAAEVLGRAALVEWAVVALFYRAVHLVEARFATEDVHHSTHAARVREVNRRLPGVGRDFARLLHLSRIARYEPTGLITAFDYEVARRHFAEIEAAIGGEPRP
jgi:hypothetical protein